MRGGVVRQAVGADHGVLEGEHALHVGLVHGEVDRRGRLQLVDCLLDRQSDIDGMSAGHMATQVQALFERLMKDRD